MHVVTWESNKKESRLRLSNMVVQTTLFKKEVISEKKYKSKEKTGKTGVI